ncbi:MAG: glycosyltransferase family 4 protein [Fuerstiella sp.]|nr:glycosyltransferase family 4 protein [Fuerstiella sp.]
MKILTISHSYVAPENQKNLETLAEHADVCAVVPDRISSAIFDEQIGDGPASLKVFRRVSLPRSQYLLMTIDMGMREFRPDIIHIEYDPWSMIFWQMSVCRLLFARQARVICTVKKNTYRKLRLPLAVAKKAIGRFFAGRVDHFIAVSRRAKAIYQEQFGIPETRIDIVQHLGVDLAVFHPNEAAAQDDELTIGYCGRFDANKGVLDLIEAVRRINVRRSTPVQLRLLGSGSLKQSLLDREESWLRVLEPVPHAQVAPFLQSLDVFAMPSHVTPDHEEHDGHALMEALACGVSCVGADSGIIPELLDNNAGLVFTAGNIEELTSQLLRLVKDTSLRQNLGANAAQQAAALFSNDGIARQKIRIYANAA